MNIRYHVELSEAERCELTALVGSGKHYARKIKRAQIPLAADSGLSDEDIAAAVAVGRSTVYRTKRRFVKGNLEAALNEEPRAGADRKLTSNEEALLIATACSSPPEGRARWTLELLAGAMVKLTDHDSLSRETVRRRLAENHLDFPEAERIRVVLDNLSTHTAAALYAGFPPAEARRVLRRLEFHYTPKHASWLNMVEIEIGVLKGQCLDRRIESCDRLIAEIDVWQSQRNQSGARINWMFSTDKARTKMARAYPDPSLKES